MANTDEVYQLWDSADELMCHPDIAHPVHFNIAAGQDETFEISYQGETFKKIPENIFWNFKDSLSTPSLDRLDSNNSNALLRFAILMMILLHAKQDALDLLLNLLQLSTVHKFGVEH